LLCSAKGTRWCVTAVYSCGLTSGVSLTGTETNYRQRHTDICVASITGEDQRTASTTIARYSLCGSSSSTSRGMHSYVLIHQVTPIITVDVLNRDSSEHRYWLSLIVANSIDFCNLKHVAVYSLPDQTSRREALCFLPVRSSVRSFVRFKTWKHDILKTNKPSLMQIGTTGRARETINFGVKSRGQRSHEAEDRFGGWRTHHARHPRAEWLF